MKIESLYVYNLSSSFADKNTYGSRLGLKNISIIKLKTQCGIDGFGETYVGIYIPNIVTSIINEIREYIIGRDPEEIINSKLHIPFVSRNGIFKSVYSAVDIALWDIVAKKKQKPIYELINNKKNKYKIYSSGGMVNSNLNEIEENINTAKKMNHLGFKMRVGRKSWNKDLNRIEFASKMTKKYQLELMVDAIMGTINPAWELKKDLFKIKKISKMVYWLEEPFHPDNFEDYQTLIKKKIIRVATGEALSGELDFKNYLYNKLCNIIQIDVTNCGGITEAIKIKNLAKKKGINIAMHVWGSEIASSANTQFAFAFPEVKWLEYPLAQPEINSYINSSFKNYMHYLNQPQIKCIGLGIDLELNKLNSKFKFIEDSKYKI